LKIATEPHKSGSITQTGLEMKSEPLSYCLLVSQISGRVDGFLILSSDYFFYLFSLIFFYYSSIDRLIWPDT